MLARRTLAAAVLFGGLGLAAAAQETKPAGKDEPKTAPKAIDPKADEAKPLDRADLDRRLSRLAFETSLFGSDLWKAGNYEGTFRLYQGSLATMRPLLDHRPKLQALVTDRLEKSGGLKPTEGAFLLREGLDAVQRECGEALLGSPTWAKLGGEPGVRAAVGDLVLAAVADPKVNITRGGTIEFDRRTYLRIEQAVVEYLSAKLGGPLTPTGPDLKSVLGGVKMTEAEFDAALTHLDPVLKKYKVPEAEAAEIRKALHAARKDVFGDGKK